MYYVYFLSFFYHIFKENLFKPTIDNLKSRVNVLYYANVLYLIIYIIFYLY